MKKIINYILVFVFASIILYSQGVNEQKFRLGFSYEERGEVQNAERIYEELIKSEPNNPQFFTAYTRIMKAQNKFSELLPLVSERAKKFETLENLDLFAEISWRVGNTEDANKSWEKALNKFENNFDTYSKIAQTQISLRLFEKAIATFLKGRKDIGSNGLFADELSKVYIATGNYKDGIEEIFNLLYANMNIATAQGRVYALIVNEEASKYLEGRIRKESEVQFKNMLTQELYAWLLRTINKLENALDVYIRIDELKKTNGMELLNFANISVQDGQYDIAIKAYKIIIEKGKSNPYNASAVYGVTRALELKLLSKKNFTKVEIDEILNYYENIIMDYPNSKYSADARYRYATIQYRMLNNPKLAKIHLDLIMKESPRLDVSGTAANFLAEIYISEENLVGARDLYKFVAEKNQSALPPDKEIARFMLAELEFFQGNIDTARALYVKIVQNSKSDAANDAFKRISIIDASIEFVKGLKAYSTAELLLFQNKKNEAIKYYQEASESSKNSKLSETSLMKLSEIYFELKMYDNAISSINALIAENAESIFADDAYMMLGDCYTAQNKTAEAIKAYSDLLVKFPDSVMLQQARKKIRLLRNEKN